MGTLWEQKVIGIVNVNHMWPKSSISHRQPCSVSRSVVLKSSGNFIFSQSKSFRIDFFQKLIYISCFHLSSQGVGLIACLVIIDTNLRCLARVENVKKIGNTMICELKVK